MAKKSLAVFDFDHTIADDNTDIVVRKLLRNVQIPEKLKTMDKKSGWTTYMQKIFQLLHKYNISETEIRNAIIKIPAVSHIPELITTLVEKLNYDVIIISDSNSVFINEWLASKSLTKYIKCVYTNPAEYNQHGLLKIKMYHVQRECTLSTVNLCKGKIMEDFIENEAKNGLTYEHVVYVGDGKNDLCPILRLSSKDVACARAGYSLVELVKKNLTEADKDKIKCKVCVWKTGEDILRAIDED